MAGIQMQYGGPTYYLNGQPVDLATFQAAYAAGTTTTPGPAPTGSTTTPISPVPADQISTVTGIDPAEVASATYGKTIPIWVGGTLRLGCHIIFGPTFRDQDGFRVCDFGVSFGMPANNIGTRNLFELRLDGVRVWHYQAGFSYTSPLVFRFYGGTEIQPADPLVIAAYPTAPVAHRGQCCIFIEGLRIADFNFKVPFVSALIADVTGLVNPDDGVNLGDGLQQIAASPYVNLSAAEFATVGISERVDAIIVAEKISFMELLSRYARLYLWDIVQTDKLKVLERGSVAPDMSLDLTNILTGDNSPPIQVQRQQQPDIAKELDYSWIDPDRDYEINTVTIKRPRAPVPVTASDGKDTISLPSVHTVQEATAWATLRKFKDELARETLSFNTNAEGYALEPGDVVSVNAGFKTYIIRVLEVLRGANWSNQIKGEPVLRCAFPVTSAGPLDGIPGLTGAWSMSRPLLSSYTGGLYETAAALPPPTFPLDGVSSLTSAFSLSRDLLTSFSGGTRYTKSGTAIITLEDQSGGNRDLSDGAVTARRPTETTAGPNSRLCADFDGTNNVLLTAVNTSALFGVSSGAVVIGLIIDAVTLNSGLNDYSNNGICGDLNFQMGLYAANDTGVRLFSVNLAGAGIDGTPNTTFLTTGTACILMWRHHGGLLYFSINGGTEVSVASGNTTNLASAFLIGSSGTNRSNIKVFELFTTSDGSQTAALAAAIAAMKSHIGA
jgi:hypothetical protein